MHDLWRRTSRLALPAQLKPEGQIAVMSADTPIEIDVTSVHGKLAAGDKFLFVDCREQDEFDSVKIDGAVLLPMSQFAERVGEIEAHREADVIVHCHHGGRSLRVANWLRQQGFEKAQSMAGGIDAWAVQIEPGMLRY
jgi:rhodanese-related sulfurtransferase